MPAKGVKIVGECLAWCSISSSFQNSFQDVWASRLWVSGVLVEFGPILAWYRFLAAEELSLMYLRLMMSQMFSIGERSGLHAGQFSTRTLLLRSHTVVIAAVCGFVLSFWHTRHLEGSICCSKSFIYLSAFIVPSKTNTVRTYAPPYHQRYWLLNWMMIPRWKISLLFSPEDKASAAKLNLLN